MNAKLPSRTRRSALMAHFGLASLFLLASFCPMIRADEVIREFEEVTGEVLATIPVDVGVRSYDLRKVRPTDDGGFVGLKIEWEPENYNPPLSSSLYKVGPDGDLQCEVPLSDDAEGLAMIGSDVIQTATGDYVVAGTNRNETTEATLAIVDADVSLDAGLCETGGVRFLSFPTERFDRAGFSEVTQTADGFIATGWVYNGLRHDLTESYGILVVKLSFDFELVWQSEFSARDLGIAARRDDAFVARSVAASVDENGEEDGIVVGGTIQRDYPASATVLIRLDTDGNPSKLLVHDDRNGLDSGSPHVISSSDGNFVFSATRGDDALIVKVNPAGEILWEETLGRSETSLEADSVAETNECTYRVFGDEWDRERWEDLGGFVAEWSSDGALVSAAAYRVPDSTVVFISGSVTEDGGSLVSTRVRDLSDDWGNWSACVVQLTPTPIVDCDGNVIDLCNGDIQDCDRDGILDRCEPDRDENGVPDDCELRIEVTPSSLDFGGVAVGSTKTLTVTIHNPSPGPINVCSVSLRTPSLGVSFLFEELERFVLDPGATETVAVTFDARYERERSNAIVIDVEAFGVSDVVVEMSGHGVDGTPFSRGDVNADDHVDLSDGVAILGYLFLGNAEPSCLDAADVDDGGDVDLSDAARIFNYLFLGGESPASPFGECDFDPTDDGLSCEGFEPCASS